MQPSKREFNLTKHLERKAQGRKFNIWFEKQAAPFATFRHQGMTIYFHTASMDLCGEIEAIAGEYFIYNLDGHIDFLDERQNLVGSFTIKSGDGMDNGFSLIVSRFIGKNVIDYILNNGGLDDNQD